MNTPLPGLPVLDRCAVMGVVNVTPDSFSDGGLWLDPEAAVAHGLALTARGRTWWTWAASPPVRARSG